MNSQDYKDAMRDIKPSNELNDRVINQLLNSKEDKKLVHTRNYKLRPIIICIAILSLTSISVAASTWNLTDVFKGYFKELVSGVRDNKQSDHGVLNNSNTTSIKKDSTFLNTAGAIIESTDTEAGLKLTARGIVGDDRVLYVAIDVETVSGKGFTKEEEANLNAIHFQEVKLQFDDDVLKQYCNCIRIDKGEKKGKATYLIREIINSNNIKKISGHKLTITLTNFLHTTNRLEDIGMEGNLYDIFTKFSKPADEDYQFYSIRSKKHPSVEENKILDEYYLMRRSGKFKDEFLKRREELIQAKLLRPLYYLPKTSTKVTFNSKYPKLAITNMGIKDNIFTFNMDINDELDYQYLDTKPLKLVNHETGIPLITIMDIDESEDDGRKLTKLISAHFDVFDTITSAEQLKDYYLALGGDGSEDIINEGEWILNFDLSYKDTTRSYIIDKKANIGGFDGTIKSLDISPLSLNLIYHSDKIINTENKKIFENNLMHNESDIYLVLKDGTKITPLSSDEECQNNIVTFNAMFPYVISLDLIEKIVIDGTELSIN